MGLFDNIKVHTKFLPEGKKIDFDKQDFQTKDLSCLMEHFIINEDGELVRTNRTDAGWEFVKCHEKVNYTGQIQFYDSNICFIAWVVKGMLKEIVESENN